MCQSDNQAALCSQIKEKVERKCTLYDLKGGEWMYGRREQRKREEKKRKKRGRAKRSSFWADRKTTSVGCDVAAAAIAAAIAVCCCCWFSSFLSCREQRREGMNRKDADSLHSQTKKYTRAHTHTHTQPPTRTGQTHVNRQGSKCAYDVGAEQRSVIERERKKERRDGSKSS